MADAPQYKFDPFTFIKNREGSIKVTENDLLNFNNYMSCSVLSMNSAYLNEALGFNSMAFSKLSKVQQCLAYTSLDGRSFPFKKYLKTAPKGKYTDAFKISKVLGVDDKKARSYIDNNSPDLERIFKLYRLIYEPETLVSVKTGKVKK